MASLGRAVLVGTRSVEASEKLSAVFDAQGIAHAVLNARQDEGEADAVAAAGAAGRITVATNMAGRGTDIKLSKEAEAAGGLHVILTEFHESARVDRQLFGRCARQGDPGSTEAIVSVEDDLFRRFAPAAHQLLLDGLVPARLANEHLVRRYVTWLQDRAERHYRQQRVMTQKRDAEWVKSLAFVGKSRR